VFATSTSSDVDVTWAGLRLLADGSIDPTFEPAVNLGLGLLLAAESSPDGHVTFGGIDDSVAPTLVRFTEEGDLDASFGENGVVTLGLPGSIYSMDFALQPDGKLLIGSNDWVARVLADGTLDPAFGEDGAVTLDVADEVNVSSLALDAGGRIIVGGNGFIARLLNDGTVATEPPVQSKRLILSAPAPNPASGRATLTYLLAESANVRLAVYDMLGREVAVVAKGIRPAGQHEVTLDASRLAPGLYVARLTAGDEVATHRLTAIR
jgi:hypothetical protein